MTEPLTPAVGDYVLATKWHDGEPGDPWAVGFYGGLEFGDRHMVRHADGENIRPNGYRRVGRITPEIGAWLLKNAANLEFAPGKITLWGMYDWEYVNMKVREAG